MTAQLKIAGAPMIRLSLSYIYEAANNIEPLSRLPDIDSTVSEHFFAMYVAKSAIEGLQSSIYAPYLRASFALGQDLVAALSLHMRAFYAATTRT